MNDAKFMCECLRHMGLGTCNTAADLIEQQAARIASLERERDEAIAAEEKVQELYDAMAKDAERYRWLIGKTVGMVPLVRVAAMTKGQYALRYHRELDLYIDAALAASEPKKEPT